MTPKAECARVVRNVECQDDPETVDIEDWLAVDIRRSETEARYQNIAVVLDCGQHA
jgi:CYTH domain-containing protein